MHELINAGFATIAGSVIGDAPAEEPKEIFPTGIPSIDHLIGGGIRPGELCLVLGGTGSGKTALCRTIRRTNFPQHSGDLGISEGSGDLLFLAKRHSLILTNIKVGFGLAPGVYLEEQRYNTAREIKEYALRTGEAVIWTIQANRETILSYLTIFSYLMPVDYCLNLTTEISADISVQKSVTLFKNRRCRKRTDIPIEFYYNNGVLMREVYTNY